MSYHLVVADGGKKDGLAYGSFKVFNDRGYLIAHRQRIFGLGTSNQAEYKSLIMALTYCINYGIMDISVIMDSKLTINQVKGKWGCEDKFLKRLNKIAKERVARLDSFSISYMPERFIKQKLGH